MFILVQKKKLNFTEASAPDRYQYPKIFYRFPKLIHLIFILNDGMQLRKWYVMAALKKTLKQTLQPFTMLDFGVGEGQYLIPFANNYSNSKFYGIDVIPSNIALMNAYPAKNLFGLTLDFEKVKSPVPGNIALCVGVLHYLKNDAQALSNIFDSLHPKGIFLLYSPLSKGKDIKQDSYPHYDTIHKIEQAYDGNMLLSKLKNSGFNILETVTCYGYFGKLVHSVSKKLISRIYYGSIVIKIFAALMYLVFFPFQMIGMFLDYHLPKKQGTGLLIVAQKPG